MHIRRGDVLLCNHSSYVDILYLYFRFSPVFTRVHPKKNMVAPVPMWQALLDAMRGRPVGADDEVDERAYMSVELLSARAKANWEGPVVILPEVSLDMCVS